MLESLPSLEQQEITMRRKKNKPVIIFKDNLDEGKLFGKCPKCDLFALDIFMQNDKYFLKCESCGFTCDADEFELRHEAVKAKPSDNPMQ
jgi:transcription elongation factor Elf1